MAIFSNFASAASQLIHKGSSTTTLEGGYELVDELSPSDSISNVGIQQWWEDEASSAIPIAKLRSWTKHPHNMASEAALLNLASPIPHPAHSEGWVVLRRELTRFNASKNFASMAEWEVLKVYLGVLETQTVPALFWSHEHSFLAAAANLAMVTQHTIIQIVSATHALRVELHKAKCLRFVGHLSVRIGMREDNADEAMATGILPARKCTGQEVYYKPQERLSFPAYDPTHLVVPQSTRGPSLATEYSSRAVSTALPVTLTPTSGLTGLTELSSELGGHSVHQRGGNSAFNGPLAATSPSAAGEALTRLDGWAHDQLAPSSTPQAPITEPSWNSHPTVAEVSAPVPPLMPKQRASMPPCPIPASPTSPRRARRSTLVREDAEAAALFSNIEQHLKPKKERLSLAPTYMGGTSPNARPAPYSASPERPSFALPSPPTALPTSPTRPSAVRSQRAAERRVRGMSSPPPISVVNYDDTSTFDRGAHFFASPEGQRDTVGDLFNEASMRLSASARPNAVQQPNLLGLNVEPGSAVTTPRSSPVSPIKRRNTITVSSDHAPVSAFAPPRPISVFVVPAQAGHSTSSREPVYPQLPMSRYDEREEPTPWVGQGRLYFGSGR